MDTTSKHKINMTEQFTILPESEKRLITASVGFISPFRKPDLFVVIRNNRGWDIPGGHTEKEENPLQTFEREFREETGCQLLPGSELVAILESPTAQNSGIAVYRGFCTIGKFYPSDEILERKILKEKHLLDKYFGHKEILQQLLEICRQKSY